MAKLVETRDLEIPPILPVCPGGRRRTWSVIIPTHNTPPGYLRQALTSVLEQDPGPDVMEIAVVDDASTRGDAQVVVAELGRGRVTFHRQEWNLGQARTLNRCIELAGGELVHLLHGDDYVAPGFYAALTAAAQRHPDAGLIACRSRFIDQEGQPSGVSQRLPGLEGGGRDVSIFFYDTPIQTPSVVVRRRCYEQLGGFTPDFHYAVDTEMWVRVIRHCSGVVVPDVLACYRSHKFSLSDRLSRDGIPVRETLRLNALFAEQFPGFSRERGRRRVAKMAWSLYLRFLDVGDVEAAQVSRSLWTETAPLVMRIRYAIKLWARRKGAGLNGRKAQA